MKNNTFGSPEKFATLPSRREYLSNFLSCFNRACKDIEQIYNNASYFYIVRLFRKDWLEKIKTLESKYDPKLISYIRNFIIAKIRTLEIEK